MSRSRSSWLRTSAFSSCRRLASAAASAEFGEAILRVGGLAGKGGKRVDEVSSIKRDKIRNQVGVKANMVSTSSVRQLV